MTDTLALATLLRSTDDETLVARLNNREFTVAGIRDFFDLADALLDADSIQGCLALLDRPTLSALWRLANTAVNSDSNVETGTLDLLRQMLFLDASDTVLASVAEQLNRWPSLGLPDPSELGTPFPAPDFAHTTNTESVDHIAAERAFAATTAIAELLFDLRRQPARLLARGELGVPETRRLAEAMAVDDTAVATLINAAERAGLVKRENARLIPAHEQENWLSGTASKRWLDLVAGWAHELPAAISEHLARHSDVHSVSVLLDWVVWLYPGGGEKFRNQLGERLAEAQQLGITANTGGSTAGTLSSAGAAMIGGDRARASELLAPHLPEPVHALYLQHDLTMVAPGPLDAAIDARLRSLADAEGPALASRFRLSAASIDRALTDGETAESLLEFLTGVSITPIPQPVIYLVQETAQRHGRMRVGAVRPATPEVASYIRSDDSAILGAVLVDSRLVVLGLTARSVTEIVSRRDPDQVYWALVEARYPVAAENASGTVITMVRHDPPPAPAPTINKVAKLVEKLRLAEGGSNANTAQAWLARQLESAIRSRSTVTVSVRMPNGTIVDHSLEPASVSGGRLRAKDPVSEIERTLPLSSIAAITTR
ncbi:MAG: helicase-associated domain-containing protein [Terrimesophilobacter sp.]